MSHNVLKLDVHIECPAPPLILFELLLGGIIAPELLSALVPLLSQLG